MFIGKARGEEVNLLVVGVDSNAREVIAKSLHDVKSVFDKKSVRITRELPLQADAKRPRIDYVVIVLDVSSRLSYDSGN